MTASVAEAVSALQQGELVAFPTETVYGLGADASSEDAVLKIFTAKGRPAEHPLIVHLPSVAQLECWASDVPPEAYKLMEAFSPGPLTLILKRAPEVLNVVTGGQDTVGLRVPSHPLALALLEAFGAGIAAPSANRFGRLSPTTAEHVREELGEEVSVILDGGACSIGVESTIVDLSTGRVRLLRPGGIDRQHIEAVLGQGLEMSKAAAPRVSGSLASHYAPTTPLSLIHSKDLLATVEVARSFARVAVMALQPAPAGQDNAWIHMPADARSYAQHLYSVLRDLDRLSFDRILVEAVPETLPWAAIADRLARAAA